MVCLAGCLLEPIVIFASFSAASESPCAFPVCIFADDNKNKILLDVVMNSDPNSVQDILYMFGLNVEKTQKEILYEVFRSAKYLQSSILSNIEHC